MLPARHVRALRGGVTAVIATFLALVSHVTAGGPMPGVVGIVVPLVFAVLVSVLLAGRTRSVWRLTLSVALSQVLFHLLFVLGTPTAAATQTAGHAAHGAVTLSLAPATHSAYAIHGDPTMWMHHAVAAVLTIALIAQSERILAGLAAFGWHVLRRLAPPVWLPVSLEREPSLVVRLVPAARTLAHRAAPSLLRGPPLLTHAV